nr:lysophospholipid acyltransferase 2-like [Lytechinus pictus]
MEFEVLHKFCDKIGLRYCEANFVMCQCLTMVFSFVFRAYCGPSKASPTTRHAVFAVFGLLLAVQAIGWEILHLLLVSTIGYLIMNLMSPHIMQYYASGFAILYLSGIHIWFMIIGRGVNNFDIVGPLMVLTEKVGCLAWSVHDGISRKDSDMNAMQKKMVVRSIPSILEYVSFMFYPQSLLCGPIVYYADYSVFIHGTKHKVTQVNSDGKAVIIYREPSAAVAIMKKLIFTIFCALVLLFLVPKYPIMANVDEDHLANSSFWYKMFCMMISVEFAKSKYFFGWVLADAIHNAAGMGFNGYDDKGNPKWDAASNVNVWNFEFPTNLKVLVDSWNRSTLVWLRYTCYDRVTFQPALMTFLLSSIWHGFFPGLFVTFLSGHLMLMASKKVRANVRPLFQGSYQSSAFYDVLTWATTYVTLAYIITPFTYLRLDLSIKFFNSIYWWLHIVAIITLLVLPARKRLTTKMNDNNKVNGAKDSSSSTLTGQSGGGVEEVKKDL